MSFVHFDGFAYAVIVRGPCYFVDVRFVLQIGHPTQVRDETADHNSLLDFNYHAFHSDRPQNLVMELVA